MATVLRTTISMRAAIYTIVCLLSLWLGVGWSYPAAFAADLSQGSQVFELHCAGCHLKGGNIVRRGKTLQLKALERNQVNTLEAIADLVSYGKANMSAYQNKLTAEEIQSVSAYVLHQAQTGWKA